MPTYRASTKPVTEKYNSQLAKYPEILVSFFYNMFNLFFYIKNNLTCNIIIVLEELNCQLLPHFHKVSFTKVHGSFWSVQNISKEIQGSENSTDKFSLNILRLGLVVVC